MRHRLRSQNHFIGTSDDFGIQPENGSGLGDKNCSINRFGARPSTRKHWVGRERETVMLIDQWHYANQYRAGCQKDVWLRAMIHIANGSRLNWLLKTSWLPPNLEM